MVDVASHAREAELASARVAVVGAGLSGLYAARRLRDAGASVVVLEARDRVGGRTLSREIDGAVFDLGGQWIGPGQRRLRALADELSIETFPTFCDGKKILDLDGSLSEYRSAIPSLGILRLVQLKALISYLDGKAKGIAPEDPTSAVGAADLDAITLESYRRLLAPSPSVRALTDVAVRTIFGAEAGEMSALYFLTYLASGGGLLRLSEIRGGAQQDRFLPGAQAFANRLAEQLGDAIHLEAPVSAVHQDERSVRLETPRGTVLAERVVLALPPALAGRIAYRPALPASRDRLTQRMPMGATVKVLLTYDAPFWRQAGFSGEVVSTHGPLSVVFDNCSSDGSRAALLGFVVGRRARAFAVADDDARKQEVLDSLVRYFGREAAFPRTYTEQDWSAEAHTRGCPVAVAPPGALLDGASALRAPIGRLHFAGTESAREWMGYLEGALEAAERVADEILRRLT